MIGPSDKTVHIETVFDHLIEGFQLISRDWRYLYANDSVVKQSKCPGKDDLLGYTMMEKFPGIEKTEMFKCLERCMNERIPLTLENEFRFPDGSVGWFELRIAPVPEGVFIVSMDITERKHAMKILEEKVRERTLEVVQQKEVIEEKNRRMADSIAYAKRIQLAKFPRREDIYYSFPDSFILFKPKDVVSGDFYFFDRAKERVFLAAADCTGHGVPGALLSILGSEILKSAVADCEDISEILKRLNVGVKTSLKQSGNDIHSRDGMDIALCCIDLEKKLVKYSGANRPFWLVRKGEKEIHEIKPTKMAIGGYTEDEQHFEAHELFLLPGDTFYIFSDGYADQFGVNGKKLTTKRLKDILLSIQQKSMREQKIFLRGFAEKWTTGQEQIDDILMIGVRV